MAFELPDHLPKGGFSRDKATQILNKLGQTSFQQLNADLVASWVAELDDAITETKVRFQLAHEFVSLTFRLCLEHYFRQNSTRLARI